MFIGFNSHRLLLPFAFLSSKFGTGLNSPAAAPDFCISLMLEDPTMRAMHRIGFAVLISLIGFACGDSDDAASRLDLRQLNAGLPGAWIRTTPCPLESSAFCEFYLQGLEI